MAAKIIKTDSAQSSRNECKTYLPVADPDFELRLGPGFGLLALPAFLPSVMSSFSTQNKEGVGGGGGGGRGPLGPSLDPPLFTKILLIAR